jgi:Uma2 family endonuclease
VVFKFRSSFVGILEEILLDNVHLNDKNNCIPDVVVVCDRSKIKMDGIYGAPDLAVEVLSPSTAFNDMSVKKDIYEKFGVREYWIVDPVSKMLSVYVNNNNKFTLSGVYYHRTQEELLETPIQDRESIVGSFHSAAFPDLVVDLDTVFEGTF